MGGILPSSKVYWSKMTLEVTVEEGFVGIDNGFYLEMVFYGFQVIFLNFGSEAYLIFQGLYRKYSPARYRQ